MSQLLICSGSDLDDCCVYDTTVQTDGKVVIVGDFDAIDGTARGAITRLSTINAAAQTVSISPQQPDINWLRSGSSVEVNRTTLETSSDGFNWGSPVQGKRTNGGWQFSRPATLQPESTAILRLRGYYGGASSDSKSITETLYQVYIPANIEDELCIPIKLANGNLAVICL